MSQALHAGSVVKVDNCLPQTQQHHVPHRPADRGGQYDTDIRLLSYMPPEMLCKQQGTRGKTVVAQFRSCRIGCTETVTTLLDALNPRLL